MPCLFQTCPAVPCCAGLVLNEETGHIIGIGKATYNRLSELASPCPLQFTGPTLPLPAGARGPAAAPSVAAPCTPRWLTQPSLTAQLAPLHPPPPLSLALQSTLATWWTRWQAPSLRRPPAQTRPPGPGAAARPGAATHPDNTRDARGVGGKCAAGSGSSHGMPACQRARGRHERVRAAAKVVACAGAAQRTRMTFLTRTWHRALLLLLMTMTAHAHFDDRVAHVQLSGVLTQQAFTDCSGRVMLMSCNIWST